MFPLKTPYNFPLSVCSFSSFIFIHLGPGLDIEGVIGSVQVSAHCSDILKVELTVSHKLVKRSNPLGYSPSFSWFVPGWRTKVREIDLVGYNWAITACYGKLKFIPFKRIQLKVWHKYLCLFTQILPLFRYNSAEAILTRVPSLTDAKYKTQQINNGLPFDGIVSTRKSGFQRCRVCQRCGLMSVMRCTAGSLCSVVPASRFRTTVRWMGACFGLYRNRISCTPPRRSRLLPPSLCIKDALLTLPVALRDPAQGARGSFHS